MSRDFNYVHTRMHHGNVYWYPRPIYLQVLEPWTYICNHVTIVVPVPARVVIHKAEAEGDGSHVLRATKATVEMFEVNFIERVLESVGAPVVLQNHTIYSYHVLGILQWHARGFDHFQTNNTNSDAEPMRVRLDDPVMNLMMFRVLLHYNPGTSTLLSDICFTLLSHNYHGHQRQKTTLF